VRRSTPSAVDVRKRQAALLGALAGVAPEAIVRALEPHVTEARSAKLQAVFARRIGSVAVLFDRLYDPHNGAAVLRSCEAFGLPVVFAIEKEGQPFLASRAVSRGAERWVELRGSSDTGAVIASARAAGFELVATHPEGELEPPDLAAIPRVCLVIGNEKDGIRPELREACARSVRIPMRGFVESLNLSVTTAVLLSHATRGRGGDLSEAAQRELYARALVLSLARSPELLEAAGVVSTGIDC
jgi:tRNA (guanosine-2'-O-)-methyltransferase